MIQFTSAAVNIAGVIDGIESEDLGVFLVVVGFAFFFLIDTRKITRLALSKKLKFLGD